MKIAMIGCGNMGKGMAERLHSQNELFFFDRNEERAGALEQRGLGKAFKNLQDFVPSSDMVILAVKPQNLEDLAPLLNPYLIKGSLLVSLLTGKTLETLTRFFPEANVVRMMPNLALVHGKGVIGLTTNPDFPLEERTHLSLLFQCLGQVYWLPENKLDALSSLAGSGPAFIFIMVESMIEAGIYMGLSANESQELILQTLRGSLALMEHSSKHPGELKWQITSPKGMTIEGLKKLEELGLRASIINGFISAFEKAKKIAEE